MADYFCFPLWDLTPGMYGDIDPRTLPMSIKLQQRLLRWAKKYDEILNLNDPAITDFENENDRLMFRMEGYELAHALQMELGVEYKIIPNIVV